MARLLDLIEEDVNRQDNLRGFIASVASAQGRRVTLNVPGGTVAGIPIANSYLMPSTNDVVLVLKLGTSWLVVCAIG